MLPIQLINTTMRAREFCESEDLDRHSANARRPIISLRHANKLKRMKAARRDEYAQWLALLGLMYGQDSDEERKLDQREADLDAREDELRIKELKVDIEKAINHAEIDQKAQQRLHQRAMADLRRRQKMPQST